MHKLNMKIWSYKHKKMMIWGDDFSYINDNGIVALVNGGMLINPNEYKVLLGTGYTDKNGKEIFMGDRLKSDTLFDNGNIQTFCVDFKYAKWSFENEKGSAATSYPSFHSNASRLEIIGNIHEDDHAQGE